MRLLSISLCLFLVLFCVTGVRSQEIGRASSPIQIEADRMETYQEKNTVIFSGHVKANQDELVINADVMTVRYAGTGHSQGNAAEIPAEGLSQQIDKITAKGNVEIVQGGWVAAGDSMDFNADKRIVILKGNAKAWQEQNMVSGDKIILYLNEGRSVVERGAVEGERVKAFIYPGSQEENNGSPEGR